MCDHRLWCGCAIKFSVIYIESPSVQINQQLDDTSVVLGCDLDHSVIVEEDYGMDDTDNGTGDVPEQSLLDQNGVKDIAMSWLIKLQEIHHLSEAALVDVLELCKALHVHYAASFENTIQAVSREVAC